MEEKEVKRRYEKGKLRKVEILLGVKSKYKDEEQVVILSKEEYNNLIQTGETNKKTKFNIDGDSEIKELLTTLNDNITKTEAIGKSNNNLENMLSHVITDLNQQLEKATNTIEVYKGKDIEYSELKGRYDLLKELKQNLETSLTKLEDDKDKLTSERDKALATIDNLEDNIVEFKEGIDYLVDYNNELLNRNLIYRLVNMNTKPKQNKPNILDNKNIK